MLNVTKKVFSLATTLITISSHAVENYLIEKGDTLSEIAAKKIKDKKIYGKDGSLSLLLKENTKIKNPNKIYPTQLIYIPGSLSIETPGAEAPTTAEVQETKPTESHTEAPTEKVSKVVHHPFKLGAFFLFGPTYSSLTQSKQLGKSEVAIISFQSAKRGMNFHKGNYSGYTTVSTYKFKSKQFYSDEVVGGWKALLLGLGREDQPIYENQTSSNTLSKQSLTYLSMGLKKTLILEEAKNKFLQVRGQYLHPLSMDTEQSGLDVESVSGFGLKGTADYSFEIAKRFVILGYYPRYQVEQH